MKIRKQNHLIMLLPLFTIAFSVFAQEPKQPWEARHNGLN